MSHLDDNYIEPLLIRKPSNDLNTSLDDVNVAGLKEDRQFGHPDNPRVNQKTEGVKQKEIELEEKSLPQ